MEVTCVKPEALSANLIATWRELQQSNPHLSSPFFCPEFTRIVGAYRPDTEVGVVEDGGQVVAFFPYQRGRYSTGKPVGGIISDYQGLICRPDWACDPLELLRGCRLAAWEFDHLVAAQPCFRKFWQHETRSPRIDLSAGYEAYVKARCDAGSEQIKKCGNLTRRLEREGGRLRFEADVTGVEALNQLFAWKSEQYLRSSLNDTLGIGWVRAILREIHATRSTGFAGALSVLYAGDRMVAAHFGMRSDTVWHYWFPAYDPAYSKYSPGLILLLKLAESAASGGLKTLDLGKGESPYKLRLMNGEVPLAEGSVDRPCLVTFVRRAKRRAQALMRVAERAEPDQDRGEAGGSPPPAVAQEPRAAVMGRGDENGDV
jgi:CelD/BcsL family acetyltransferase involved in cellulose biosynthesis